VVDSEKNLKKKTTKHLGKKLNDGKQPFLWSYHFTMLF